MSVETIHKVILHPFISESLSSLKSMTNLEGKVDTPFIDDVEGFRFKGYAICSDMEGDLNGVILMHHYEETAVAIGNAVCESMLGETSEREEIDESLAFALAEWGNTIVGRATNTLHKHNLGFDFSSPQCALTMDDMETYLQGVEKIITVPVHIENVGRYYFNLLVRDINKNAKPALEQAPASQPIQTAPPEGEPLPLDSKILVVDDSWVVRKAMNKFLNELGYDDVIEASNGAEAISLVHQHQPDFMFMDVVMDAMNGDHALAEIRQFNNDIPIVMLSSVTDEKTVKRCYDYGISGFIFKPINTDNGPGIIKAYLKK